MNMSMISLETTAAAAPAGAPGAPPSTTMATDNDFADRLSLAYTQQLVGQNLAAGMPTLQTLTLGPTLEVVTTPADRPDGDSLARFAKAQGLDDEVVAWLFSDPAQMPGAPPLFPNGLTGATSPAIGTSIETQTVTTTPGLASSSLATLTAPPLLQQPAAVAMAPPSARPIPDPAASVLALMSPAANWLQQMDATPRSATASAASANAATEQVAPLSPFNPVSAFTSPGQAARAAGAPQPQPAAPPGTMPTEVLTLVIEPELEALWDEDTAPDMTLEPLETPTERPLAAAGASSGAGQAPGEDSPLASTSAARAEGYEALSQRVGEALAQRVISQIERGQWQVRLLLKPAKLGEVEIDLKMQGGELDASFRAANPVTRDLLNDGLSRLREVLANSGMEIADLNVANGRSQQHGGNPTPRQSATPLNAPAPAPSPETGSSVASATMSRRTPGSDWDVLV